MQELKTKIFETGIQLASFVNSNNIGQDDIVAITESKGGYTLFYFK